VSENIEVNKENAPVFHPLFDRKQKSTVAIIQKNGVFGQALPKTAKKLHESETKNSSYVEAYNQAAFRTW
jgi:hypothetical protein